MKTPTSFSFPLLCFALSLFCYPVTALANYEYDPENDPVRARLVPVVETYKEHGKQASIQRLEEVIASAEAEGVTKRKMYNAIWREAQLHAGRKDPAIGEALYEWILLDSTGGDLSGNTNFHSGGILLGNLVGKCRAQGKLGQSRYWANFGIRHLESTIGCSLDISRYPAQGSLFQWLPEAQSRAYPMRFGDNILPRVKEYLAPRKWQANYLMHFSVFKMHDIEMDQCFYEGNWVRAAELADWLRQYVITAEATETEPKKNYWWNRRRALHTGGTWILEQVASLHGYDEKAILLNREALEDYPAKGHFNLAYVRMRRLQLLAKTGLGEPEELEEGLAWLTETFEQHLTSKWGGLSLPAKNLRTQMWLLHAFDHDAEALAIINKLKEMFPGQRRDTLAAELALADSMGSTAPELEERFEELLAIYRDLGLKIHEPGLYRLYAAYLYRCGRYAEAIAMQKEALRLYRALNIHARVVEALAALAKYQSAADLELLAVQTRNTLREKLARENYPLPSQVSKQLTEILKTPAALAVIADLQPLEVATVVEQGDNPEARFLLTNPEAVPVKGHIRLVAQSEGQTQSTIVPTLTDPAGGDEPITLTQPVALTIGAQEQVPLYFTRSTLEPNEAQSYAVIWQETGNEQAIQSFWHISGTDIPASITVSEASLIEQSPFYQVPLHHFLVRSGTEQTEVIDFRLVSESKLRLEVYRESGELLYVDANSDGDFDDPGDLIASDHNENSYADISFEQGSKKQEIEIYWTAIDFDPSKTVTVHVELLEDGQWQRTASDEIIIRNGEQPVK